MPQGDVRENNVGRHGAFVGEAFAKRAEFVEQQLVAFDFAGAMFGHGFGSGDGAGEGNFLARFQRGAAFVCYFDDVELGGVLAEQTEADQFAADGGPFGTGVFAADVVGRKGVVGPFPDAFGFRAAKDFDDVLDADAETAFFADAVYAGEKFLGGDGAVECLAGGEAVVAGGATDDCRLIIRLEIGERFPLTPALSLGRGGTCIAAPVCRISLDSIPFWACGDGASSRRRLPRYCSPK